MCPCVTSETVFEQTLCLDIYTMGRCDVNLLSQWIFFTAASLWIQIHHHTGRRGHNHYSNEFSTNDLERPEIGG